MSQHLQILVDADSCPVKDEIYKVALRHQIPVKVIANSFIKIPDFRLVERVAVSNDFDAAADYIVEHADPKTVVVTADILLAERCLKVGATVLAPKGIPFTANSIGTAVATRALMEDLRAGGQQHGGPAPFSPADRSRFLAALHDALVRMKRLK